MVVAGVLLPRSRRNGQRHHTVLDRQPVSRHQGIGVTQTTSESQYSIVITTVSIHSFGVGCSQLQSFGRLKRAAVLPTVVHTITRRRTHIQPTLIVNPTKLVNETNEGMIAC
jgi:hypothetical protein